MPTSNPEHPGRDLERPAGGADHAAPLQERLQRIEEGLGFTDHQVEQLHAHVLDLTRRLDGLVRQMQRLERSLEDVRRAGAAPGAADEAEAPGPNTGGPAPAA
jgi:uncharacterized coiled-coil protein SlyX